MKRPAIALLVVAVAAAVPICGCECQPTTRNSKADEQPIATRNSKEDEELIAQFIQDWKADGTSKDLDAIMRLTSESFGLAGGAMGTKADLRKGFAYLLAQGAEIRLSEAAIIKLGKRNAIIGPCYLAVAFRFGPVRLVLEKEGALWMLTAIVLTEGEGPRAVRDPDRPFDPGKKSKDEKLVAQFIENLKAAVAGGDPQKITGAVSENFVFPEGGKAEFLKEVASFKAGTAEILLDGAAIDLENGKASVGPLEIAFAGPSIDVTFVLRKEGDEWMLIALFPGQLDEIPEVADLPDVTFPEGAFEPVEESQY